MATLEQYAILDKTLGTDSLVWIDGRWHSGSIHAAVLRQCERMARLKGTINTSYAYQGRDIRLTDSEQSRLASIAANR